MIMIVLNTCLILRYNEIYYYKIKTNKKYILIFLQIEFSQKIMIQSILVFNKISLLKRGKQLNQTTLHKYTKMEDRNDYILFWYRKQ